MNLFVGQEQRHREQTCGRSREGPVECGADRYAPPYVNGWLGAAAAQHRALSSELCHGLEVGRDGRVEGAQEGGDMCVLTADLRCMAETHPAL